MAKSAGERAILREEKRLEKEKKRRIEQANKMLIPVSKKTNQSLGIISFDPEGVFRLKENRWIKVFEAKEDTLCQIVRMSPKLLGRARITRHCGGYGGKATCHITLMETGEIYEEIRQQFKKDEDALRKVDSLRQLSVDEVMNQVAENFLKDIRFSYASYVRGNKDFKKECFAELKETKDSFAFGKGYGECLIALSFVADCKGDLVKKLNGLGCEFYLCLDMNSLSAEEQSDFNRELEKRYNRRLSIREDLDYINVSFTLAIICDSDDAKKIVEQTVISLMDSEGIMLAPAYDAQGLYMESVGSLGICDQKTIRNVDVNVVATMFGGDKNADA